VLALLVEAFLSRISSGLVKTSVPLFALLVFGFDIASIMILVLIQNIVPLLLRPTFGTLADKYGRKRVFMLSLTIRTVVSVLYAVAVFPWLFYLISVVRGIADSAKGPSASAMIADSTDEKHIATAYSWYTTVKSTSGGIGEAIAAFMLVVLIGVFAGLATVTVNVAVLDEVGKNGQQREEVIKSPADVAADGTIPATEVGGPARHVARVEQREMRLKDVPIDDLPKVVDATPLRYALVAIFLASTVLSALSLVLVAVVIKEKKKDKKEKKEKKPESAPAPVADDATPKPSVWAFALLGTALTAPAYMVTGEFFTILAVKLEVTPGALGWIKIIAETMVPLIFGPVFGWVADRIGAGKVIAMRSVANMATSLLFWITPWFVGTALLGVMMGLARGVDEIGKAAFKPTWGAIAAKVLSFDLTNRSRTMGILEGGVDASDLAFPVLAGVLLQYLSLGWLMAVRAVLALVAEVYAFALARKYRI
jgi:MFS family permease